MCPTCDKTMQLLFMDRERTIHHCPTCGTIRSELLGDFDIIVPKLVERCREYEKELTNGANDWLWKQIGIAESIHAVGAN